MGIRRFFRSFVDPSAMGEEIIASIQRSYRYARNVYPDEDLHSSLARVWIARTKANGGARGMRPELLELTAQSETQEFACLPDVSNARTLGLFFILKERPDIAAKCPEFKAELDDLLTPVILAGRGGQLEALYDRLNPNSSWSFKGAKAYLNPWPLT